MPGWGGQERAGDSAPAEVPRGASARATLGPGSPGRHVSPASALRPRRVLVPRPLVTSPFSWERLSQWLFTPGLEAQVQGSRNLAPSSAQGHCWPCVNAQLPSSWSSQPPLPPGQFTNRPGHRSHKADPSGLKFSCAEASTLEPQGRQSDTRPQQEPLEASTGRECRVLIRALDPNPGEPQPRGRCPPSQLSQEAEVAAVRQGSAADNRPLVWGSVLKAAGRPTGQWRDGHTQAYLHTVCAAHSRAPRAATTMSCFVISRVERETPPKHPYTTLSGTEQGLGASRAERPEPFTHFRAWATCGTDPGPHV